MHTERHINVKNFEGIRLKRLHSGVTARNTSEKANMLIYRLTLQSAFPARCRPRQRELSSDDQESPALPQTVPTEAANPCCTTTGSLQRVYGLSLRYKRTRKRMNYSERRGQFLRMRIRIRPQAAGDMQCGMRRGFAL